MSIFHISKIAGEFDLKERQVRAVVELLDEGATVPFIARYRKEVTGSLDEVAITTVQERLAHLRDLDKRRASILKSLRERGQLTTDLRQKILAAETLSALEDVYLPYRPKRRTRATVARERGLEPLARTIFDQDGADPVEEAAVFIDPDKEVPSVDEALAGARDIMAEWINEDADARARMRDLFGTEGVLRSKAATGKEEEGAKYRDYFDWSEPLSKAPSHRILAMMRGDAEGFLKIHILPQEEQALAILGSIFVHGTGPASRQVDAAVQDGYKRLLASSMERECLSAAKAEADRKAIAVFAENLRQLLLEPSLGQKNVLAVDPGFRTGCKVVALDRQGKLVQSDTIYPHEPRNRTAVSAKKIMELCERFEIEVIAVGNGTAGRETVSFLNGLELLGKIPVVMVDESGASVYSASSSARDEFPYQDITVRGSVSIGRRLMDPLAELVKIDPGSLGVGQYQHDVDQAALKSKLEDVVRSCVNLVGVDVNTASKELLTYVSGLGPRLAEFIVRYRDDHGSFGRRDDLRKVPRLGPKAFQQAAGFLRIRDGSNPLDASAVHPESYAIVDAMARDLGSSVQDLMDDRGLQKKIDLRKYVTDRVGMPTLEDILSELEKPGRDPRQEFEVFSFAEGVVEMKDLEPGTTLPGVVTNVTAFGAFVDVGVHQDGLVHISQLADRFVRDPAEVVKVHQKVMVTVLDVDFDRKRISLSMKKKHENDVATV
ncbi:MAG: Tex family protein [Euryarchaeota archaeon]|nr:Tex family protein [Euryarchaeota archaeon]